jgi:hypothetical protein
MLLVIEGEEATAKTTLAYTAPRPIVGFAFDMGIERALQGAKHDELFKGLDIEVKPYNYDAKAVPGWSGHDITIYELPQPVQLDSVVVKGAEELWGYFIQLAAAALTDDKVRTVVIDTATVARRVKADAYLQALQDKNPERERLLQIEYGPTNDAIRSIYTTGAGVKKNLVTTHHLTDERKERPNPRSGQIEQILTGERILEGLAQTYRYADIALRNSVKDGKVIANFRKCGYNLALQGMDIQDPTWDKICTTVERSLDDRIKLEKSSGL